MLFFLIFLVCAHFNISCSDDTQNVNLKFATNIFASIAQTVPHFLTPEYYQQIINSSCNWVKDNKHDVVTTVAVSGIAHFLFSKRTGYTIFVAGMTRLWYKSEINALKNMVIEQNKQQIQYNEEQAEKLKSLKKTVEENHQQSIAQTKQISLTQNQQSSQIASLEEKTTQNLNLTKQIQEMIDKQGVNLTVIAEGLKEYQKKASAEHQEKLKNLLDTIHQMQEQQNERITEITQNVAALNVKIETSATEAANKIIKEIRNSPRIEQTKPNASPFTGNAIFQASSLQKTLNSSSSSSNASLTISTPNEPRRGAAQASSFPHGNKAYHILNPVIITSNSENH